MPSVNFLPFLQGIPFATRIITLSLISASLVAIALSYFAGQNIDGGIPSVNLPWLVMVPGSSYWYPWTLLTAGWVELSVIGVCYVTPNSIRADMQLAISAVSLPLACRYLERVWGWKELIRFCFIVIIGSNVIAFGFSWLSYIILGTEESLYVTLLLCIKLADSQVGTTIPRTIRSTNRFPSRLHPVDPGASNSSLWRRQDESQGMYSALLKGGLQN